MAKETIYTPSGYPLEREIRAVVGYSQAQRDAIRTDARGHVRTDDENANSGGTLSELDAARARMAARHAEAFRNGTVESQHAKRAREREAAAQEMSPTTPDGFVDPEALIRNARALQTGGDEGSAFQEKIREEAARRFNES